MKIIKKDGRIEEFIPKKIITSIENAANDIGELLNESDLRVLVGDIEKKLMEIRKDSLITSSYEVVGVVFYILKRDEFSDILKSYIEHNK
ncbi:ATP cone domain-containing protein [Clostridium chauvoei]|uniref:ATP-cone domain-containing protein n=2 Tax=Clostridium chauvoei TaxID=46867 RepID=S6EIT4_9CLOT|nr:ATP cone domain-containing protein [Clostridium chauvoei]ATD54506.1 hypothetical protein BTM20_04355 [Clostridium chauvoei]ATD57812.1 hypothetical protein BTM21_08705 [Clostridium chauvoei]MBX7281056.1 hypothetical protein [Clostridium chauvoei]MBX7283557.1 hypothetical protein [Clostridium chauvoei]MBX7286029.1 hypothetical protein [Clostridium chauvoei]